MKEFYTKYKKPLRIIGIIILVAIIILLLTRNTGVKNPNRNLAQCLKDSGAKFYGTVWCNYCNSQKAMFGEDAKYLPYVECSVNGSRQSTKECKDAGITGFPTWVFSNGKRQSGYISLDQLKQLSGC